MLLRNDFESERKILRVKEIVFITYKLLKVTLLRKWESIIPQHFVAHWGHMKELFEKHNNKPKEAFPVSQTILDRAVCLPESLSMQENIPSLIVETLRKGLRQ